MLKNVDKKKTPSLSCNALRYSTERLTIVVLLWTRRRYHKGGGDVVRINYYDMVWGYNVVTPLWLKESSPNNDPSSSDPHYRELMAAMSRWDDAWLGWDTLYDAERFRQQGKADPETWRYTPVTVLLCGSMSLLRDIFTITAIYISHWWRYAWMGNSVRLLRVVEELCSVPTDTHSHRSPTGK